MREHRVETLHLRDHLCQLSPSDFPEPWGQSSPFIKSDSRIRRTFAIRRRLMSETLRSPRFTKPMYALCRSQRRKLGLCPPQRFAALAKAMSDLPEEFFIVEGHWLDTNAPLGETTLT